MKYFTAKYVVWISKITSSLYTSVVLHNVLEIRIKFQVISNVYGELNKFEKSINHRRYTCTIIR